MIADLGVDESMIRRELVAVLAPMIKHAAHTGFLEQRIRARLEPFYRSAAAAAILNR